MAGSRSLYGDDHQALSRPNSAATHSLGSVRRCTAATCVVPTRVGSVTGEDSLLLESALTAASASIGTTLRRVGQPLTGGDRAVVVRAKRLDTAGTVIVKGYDTGRAGEGWARETAALTALAGLGAHAPAVIAVVASPPVVVMEDLGSGDSVATALLGADSATAGWAVVEWAEALADLHAATWKNVGGFVAALRELPGSTPPNPEAMASVLIDGIERLRQSAGTVGVSVSEQVSSEILGVFALLDATVQVLSPFDACPDNNVRTMAGLRLIDFEGATVAHPAWDVAYLYVPWPSCWCAWRMPSALAERAQQAWRGRLQAGLAVRGVDLDWPAMEAAVGLASLVWCVITVGWFLPGALAGRRAGGEGLHSPQLRAVVQHRLGLVATSDIPELLASRRLARQLSSALSAIWQADQLPLAPAFRPCSS